MNCPPLTDKCKYTLNKVFMNYIQVKKYIYTVKHWPKKAKSPENDEVHCERGADAHLQEALQLLADDLVVEDAARHGQTGPLGLLHHALTHTHTERSRGQTSVSPAAQRL